jgi:L-lactate utilization protein LutC
MNREQFLSRVKAAAEQGRAHRVKIEPFPPETGYVGVVGDLCVALECEIDAVGGVATIVADREAARKRLSELLDEAGAKSALCWQHPVLDRLGVNELLAERNVLRIDHSFLQSTPPEDIRPRQLACDIGITSVDFAIAETGTLLVCSQPGQERVASLLPPLHVAIVEESQIVPDLIDAFALLHQRGLANLPSNVTLITGPSKTGDIELQLTTGVHGPGKWRVIVIRGQ